MEWFWYMLSNPDQNSCSLFIMSTNAKINFDAAIFTDLKATGIGVAIKDYAGDVLALLSCKSQGLFDPFITKCLALQRALTFALEIGIYEAEIE
ncbi:hypothetical protein REPUB_Repub14bG0097300 [Reevesia pubescens]